MSCESWVDLGLDADPFSPENRVIHIPSSWQRLVSLLKHSLKRGDFFVLDGPFGAGKTSFAKYFCHQQTLSNKSQAHYIQAHPLMSYQQIKSSWQPIEGYQNILLVDDADQLAQVELEQLIKSTAQFYLILLSETALSKRLEIKANQLAKLPIFEKDEALELLQKQFAKQKQVVIPQFISDMIWYKSAGLPSNILKLGSTELALIVKENQSGKGFSQANNSKTLNITIVLASLLLFIFLLMRALTNSGDSSQALQQNIEPSHTAKVSQEIEPNKNIEEKSPILWLQGKESQHFTLNLYSSDKLVDCQHFANRTPLADLQIVNMVGDSCQVYWGDFKDTEEANLQIKALPLDQFKQEPKAISFRQLKQIIQVN